MIESLQDQGKLKCCMCKKVFPPTENYYTAQLPVKANWEYPVWGNLISGVKQMALAYLCEECGEDDNKRSSDIILAIEITNANEVVYHEIAWKGKECIIVDTPKLTEKMCQDLITHLRYWGGVLSQALYFGYPVQITREVDPGSIGSP